jgi:protease-4
VFAKDPDALDQLATGEVFSADEALKHGLVDKIGFLEEAIDRAIELAKLDKDEVRVVKYKRQAALFDFYGVASARQSPGYDLLSLLELSSPRAW